MPKAQPKKKRRGSVKVVVEEQQGGGGGAAAAAAAAEQELQPDAKARGRSDDDDDGGGGGGGGDDDEQQLVFEDPYADEYESDGEVVDALAQGDGEDGEDGEDGDVDELEEQLRVWRPGIDKLGEDEVSAAPPLALLLAGPRSRARTDAARRAPPPAGARLRQQHVPNLSPHDLGVAVPQLRPGPRRAGRAARPLPADHVRSRGHSGGHDSAGSAKQPAGAEDVAAA